MKVLLTGMVNRQARLFNSAYFTFFTAVNAALLHDGHEVDWRTVIPGEKLDHDVAIIGIHALGSLSATGHKYGALWAASQLPHLPMLQDWKVRTIVAQLKNSIYLWKCKHFGPPAMAHYYNAVKYSKQLERVRHIWGGGFDKCLMPFMTFADPGRINDIHPVKEPMGFNPDAFFDVPGIEYNPDGLARKHAWTCASLSDQSKFCDGMNATWPMTRIWQPRTDKQMGGFMKKGAPSWKPVPEAEITRDHYNKEWGIILPDYGTETPKGWWRGRYKIAARAGAVLYCGNIHTDVSVYHNSVQDIENASVLELSEMQDAQSFFLRSWTQSKNKEAADLTSNLERACPPLI